MGIILLLIAAFSYEPRDNGGSKAVFTDIAMTVGEVTAYLPSGLDVASIKVQFLEAFGKLNEEFKPFDSRLAREELLAIQEASLGPAEQAVSSARLLPGPTLPSVQEIPLDIIVNLLQLFTCLGGRCEPFIFVPTFLFCSPQIPEACILDVDVKPVRTSEFQLFSFVLSVALEKEALELFNPGDRFVTAIPFLGFGPSFSIVEIKRVVEDTEFVIIEFSIEGVSAVPEQVDIDIMPEEDSNVIEVDDDEEVEVAVLSTLSFDAPNQVDRGSLTFGRLGNEESLIRDDGDEDDEGGGGTPACEVEDVNEDGLPDLVCEFEIRQAGFQPDNSEGILTGSIGDSVFIQGRDSVTIVPPTK